MKNVIFDWSGVVKDCVLGQLWIVNRIFEKFGATPISLKEFKENWEQPFILFFNKYLPKLSIEEEQIAYKEAIFNKDCPKSYASSGIVELIKKLKSKGTFLAVVSSDFPETIFPELKEDGLENIFDEIVTNTHNKFEAVQDIIKKNNLNLEDTFFIGDSNHEIEVAKKTGIKSVAVTWGFNSEQKLRAGNPDFIVENTKELESIFVI